MSDITEYTGESVKAFKKVNPDFDYFEFVDACKKPYPEDWKRK